MMKMTAVKREEIPESVKVGKWRQVIQEFLRSGHDAVRLELNGMRRASVYLSLRRIAKIDALPVEVRSRGSDVYLLRKDEP